MDKTVEGNDLSKRSTILEFLDSTEGILENGKRYITSRFLPVFRDHITYNITERSFIQDDKKKYAITLTLTLVFDEDEIIQRYEDTRNRQDRISHKTREQIEDEKKKADEYLKRREEKLKKMKSKD